MQTCKTCKHWTLEVELDYDQDLPNYKIRHCKNPKMKCNELPLKNTASAHDYGDYKADFITGEDFGCVLHEAI